MRNFKAKGFDWYALMEVHHKLFRLFIDSTGYGLRDFHRMVFGKSISFSAFEDKLRNPMKFKLIELRVLSRALNKHNIHLIVTTENLIDIAMMSMKQDELNFVDKAAKVRNRHLALRKSELEKALGQSHDMWVKKKLRMDDESTS